MAGTEPSQREARRAAPGYGTAPGPGRPPMVPPRPVPPAPPQAPTLDTTAADQIVTGEAVLLDLRPANVGRRILAALMDMAIAGGLAIVVLTVALRFIASNQAQLTTIVVLCFVLAMLVVPVTVETVSRGSSVGKLALGLRVVRDDGGVVRFRQAFVRALVGILEIWTTSGAVALVTAVLNRRGKRLGDLAAGTLVIERRGDGAMMPPLLMPPELAAWAMTADVAALPEGLAWHARNLLSRTPTLEPAARTRIAQGMAAAVEKHVSPPPPWGTNPERFVAAVLVVRRDQEYLTGLDGEVRLAEQRRQALALPYGLG